MSYSLALGLIKTIERNIEYWSKREDGKEIIDLLNELQEKSKNFLELAPDEFREKAEEIKSRFYKAQDMMDKIRDKEMDLLRDEIIKQLISMGFQDFIFIGLLEDNNLVCAQTPSDKTMTYGLLELAKKRWGNE